MHKPGAHFVRPIKETPEREPFRKSLNLLQIGNKQRKTLQTTELHGAQQEEFPAQNGKN